MEEKFCQYYLAQTNKSKTWFVVGALRNEDNLVFERTIDTQNSILEFFVTKNYEDQFLKIMNHFKELGYILNIQKAENRLIDQNL